MVEGDPSEQDERHHRRPLEPFLYLVGLPVASYMVLGLLAYALLSAAGAFGGSMEISVVSNEAPTH